MLQVGGRIVYSDERKTRIVLGRNHIARLLVKHFYDKVKHSGRLWITGDLNRYFYLCKLTQTERKN